MDERIDEIADGNIGFLTALLALRAQFGDARITQFLDKIPEKGENLWNRFRRFQAGEGGKEWMNFGRFFCYIIKPKLEL